MTRLSAANRAALAEVRAQAERDRPGQMARIGEAAAAGGPEALRDLKDLWVLVVRLS